MSNVFATISNVIRQSACLVINPITVVNYAALFNCTPEDRATGSMMSTTYSYSFQLIWTGALSSVVLFPGAKLMIFICFSFPVVLFDVQGSTVTQHVVSAESSSLLLHSTNTFQSDIKIYAHKFSDESNDYRLFVYICPQTSG